MSLWIKIIGYTPLVLGVLSLPVLPFTRGWWLLAGLLGAILCWWLVLRNTLDLVQGVGPVYWLTRQTTARCLSLRMTFMMETDYPWRSGRGVQVVVPYRTFQIGLCQASKHYTQEEGLLHSLVARKLPSKPEDIRTWH